MKRYEYRIANIIFPGGPYGHSDKKNESLLVNLNMLGQDGWRLKRVFGDTRHTIASWSGKFNLLLEREIED